MHEVTVTKLIIRKPLKHWLALPATVRANLVESLERDDLSAEGQAAAELLKAIDAAQARRRKR